MGFGLRLNGGATCMSPRRLFATPSTMSALRPLLLAELAKIPAVALDAGTSTRLRAMLDEASNRGAEVQGALAPGTQKPLLVDQATANMAITRSDIFAPVLSLIEAESMLHVPALYAQCSYGPDGGDLLRARQREEGAHVGDDVGCRDVADYDIIAPTADPRVPFGGRRASGYGVTRGAEGCWR